MKSLQELYQDKETLNLIKSYLEEFIRSEGIRMLFEREDTKGVADARDIVGRAWENLDTLFEIKKPKITQNEAR